MILRIGAADSAGVGVGAGAGGVTVPGGKTSSSLAQRAPLHKEADTSAIPKKTPGTLEFTCSPHEDFTGLSSIRWPNDSPHLHGLNEAGGAVIAHFKAALQEAGARVSLFPDQFNGLLIKIIL